MWRRGLARRGLVAVALLAGSVTVVAALPAPGAHAAPDAVSFQDQIFALLNQNRAAEGLAPLTRNASLDRDAREWSEFMAGGGCNDAARPICHRKDGARVAASATAPLKWKWWAENVQYALPDATPEETVTSLMNSPGHRANIMRPATNLVGIGVAIGPHDLIFVTHEFAQLPIPPPAPAPKLTNPCGKVSSTFSYGARGAKVRVLQCALAALGLYESAVDGRFGKATRAAVKAFQASKGLKQTGSANLVTRRALGISK